MDEQKLVLIRGLPGSGKSTLARILVDELGFAHYEADMYMSDPSGAYAFSEAKLTEAHGWCLDQTRTALQAGRSVVVANTFAKLWMLDPYERLAVDMTVPSEILEASGQFQGIHGVPADKIDAMRNGWEFHPLATRL